MVFLSKRMTTYHFKAMDEKKEKPTQKKMILAHLRNFGIIESLTDLREYGCYALSQMIRGLRNEGHDIVTEIISTTCHITGNAVHFTKYILR